MLICPMSVGGALSLGDPTQEPEIKDASWRYRHARRAPVDEMTLQPGRRVSKAGLESAINAWQCMYVRTLLVFVSCAALNLTNLCSYCYIGITTSHGL
jgi:hypothetical protein